MSEPVETFVLEDQHGDRFTAEPLRLTPQPTLLVGVTTEEGESEGVIMSKQAYWAFRQWADEYFGKEESK